MRCFEKEHQKTTGGFAYSGDSSNKPDGWKYNPAGLFRHIQKQLGLDPDVLRPSKFKHELKPDVLYELEKELIDMREQDQIKMSELMGREIEKEKAELEKVIKDLFDGIESAIKSITPNEREIFEAYGLPDELPVGVVREDKSVLASELPLIDEIVEKNERLNVTYKDMSRSLSVVHPGLGKFVTTLGSFDKSIRDVSEQGLTMLTGLNAAAAGFALVTSAAQLLVWVFNDTEERARKHAREMARINSQGLQYTGDRRNAKSLEKATNEQLDQIFNDQADSFEVFFESRSGQRARAFSGKEFIDKLTGEIFGDDALDAIEVFRNQKIGSQEWRDLAANRLRSQVKIMQSIEDEKTNREIDLREESGQLVADSIELNHRKIVAQINAQAEAEKEAFNRWINVQHDLQAHRLRIEYADRFTSARNSEGLTSFIERDLQSSMSRLRNQQVGQHAEGLTEIGQRKETALFNAEKFRDTMIEALERAKLNLDTDFTVALAQEFQSVIGNRKAISAAELAGEIDTAYSKYSVIQKSEWTTAMDGFFSGLEIPTEIDNRIDNSIDDDSVIDNSNEESIVDNSNDNSVVDNSTNTTINQGCW